MAKTLNVAIVGAGYAGLSAGLTLARAGRSVAAFGVMNPGKGASSRNGGITSETTFDKNGVVYATAPAVPA